MMPLEGIRVVEFANLGPVQLAGMLLADLGAQVTVIDRIGVDTAPVNPLLRGRTIRGLDLKTESGRAEALGHSAEADLVIEGFRPGVMERLGLGPRELARANPAIVYGRMTGWGQYGPLAHKAGHDINYLAETGALWAIRLAGSRPTAPLNLVGDNGGGALYLVMGLLAALRRRDVTGRGSVVDAAIVDGASSLLQTVRGLQAEGAWADAPASNLFDTGAPFYDTYECADGEYMAVGAIEPQFYASLLEGLGLRGEDLPDRADPAAWPELRERLGLAFRERSRAEWEAVFEPLDACVSPVRSLEEASRSTHLNARGTLHATAEGLWSAAPAPRILPLPDQDLGA